MSTITTPSAATLDDRELLTILCHLGELAKKSGAGAVLLKEAYREAKYLANALEIPLSNCWPENFTQDDTTRGI